MAIYGYSNLIWLLQCIAILYTYGYCNIITAAVTPCVQKRAFEMNFSVVAPSCLTYE